MTVYDDRVTALKAAIAALPDKATGEQTDSLTFQLAVAEAVVTLHETRLAVGPTDPAYVAYQATRTKLAAQWESVYPTTPPPV